jgi:hypothetical protein
MLATGRVEVKRAWPSLFGDGAESAANAIYHQLVPDAAVSREGKWGVSYIRRG